MHKNIGKWDQVIRIAVGVAILSFWFVDPSSYFWLVGIVPIATAFIKFCPLYRVAGVSTCGLKTKDPQ